MAELRLHPAPTRDPAWLGRVFWASLCLVLLWPLGVATEFRPWVLLEPDNLKITGQFLGSFWPLAHGAEFLALVARETWRTVAMATVGLVLALVVAIPLTLISTRVLSISALSGQPFINAYCASKGALTTLTANTAFSVMANRIRVNQLNVGWMASDHEREIQAEGGDPDWEKKAAAARPFGRLVDPAEAGRVTASLQEAGEHKLQQRGRERCQQARGEK